MGDGLQVELLKADCGSELTDALDCERRAERYLKSLPPDTRRKAGLVYTPLHLVEFILDLSGYRSDKPLDDRRVLEPACGAGAFLTSAMHRLARSLEGRGLKLATATGRRDFAHVAEKSLFGLDSDPRAKGLALSSLRAAFTELTNAPPPRGFLGRNILCKDFLGQRSEPLLFSAAADAVDLIVGNPPYVPTTRLTSDQKSAFRSRFETAHGRIDLYALFMEQAINCLTPTGRLAFITPNKYLTSHTGRRLRALLLREGALVAIANFRSHRVFPDAATVPCVTVFEKAGTPGEIQTLDCGGRPRDGQVPVIRLARVAQRGLSSEGWQLGATKLRKLADRIIRDHPPLEAFAARISAGPATGRDSLFIFSQSKERDIESELLRPAVRGRDISPYSIGDPGLTALVPYTYSRNGEPHLVNLRDFPRARRFLQRHKSVLLRRHCVRVWRKAWYDLHDPVPFDIARAAKILVPDVAERNRFAHDRGRFLPLHSAYYIIAKGVDPDFLTALLNSTPLTFFVRLFAPVVKDGFSRYRRQFLARLPVPCADKKLMSRIATAGWEQDDSRLDDLVASALRISEADLGRMRSFVQKMASRAH